MQRRRGAALLHAAWFVAGFSFIFMALGASASALGNLLLHYQVWLGRVGGVLVLLFGLYLLGGLRPAFLMRERKIEFASKPIGYVATALVGMTFGAASTPCIVPILAGILPMPAARAGARQGTRLLGAQAAG